MQNSLSEKIHKMIKEVKEFYLFLMFLISSTLIFPVHSCDESSLNQCLSFGGGETCFKRHDCDPIEYSQLKCQKFDLENCLLFKGGDGCHQIQEECSESFAKERNNLEGYLSLFNFNNQSSSLSDVGSAPTSCDHSTSFIKVNANIPRPENFLQNFIEHAHLFGQNIKTYSLGNYYPHKTDCSGFLMQVMRKMGLTVKGPQFDLAPNYPNHFIKCDPNNLKPGDLLLLNKPNRDPDHWIMITSKGRWPSENLKMMDVSSDYVDGKTYYKGPLSRRRNLMARDVYSCVRHKDLDKRQGISTI